MPGVPSSPRVIAFYLPQYHPVPENDEWWGKGFTEWTNTAKAKPLFPGHYQPHVPADLGFYDLRVPETRAAQAQLASQYGIGAFCYYHYWFGGKQLLERPFNEVLASGEPDFPFCLCWANQTWSGIWHGAPEKILIEQTYPGEADHRAHFQSLLAAFTDKRHVLVDQKPLFVVYRPMELPDPVAVTDLWREMALRSGLKGLFLVGVHENPEWNPSKHGFDASMTPKLPSRRGWISWRHPWKKLKQEYEVARGMPTVYSYRDVLPDLLHKPVEGIENYPCVVPNWDNTPRSGANGLVLHDSSPELFQVHVRQALEAARALPAGHQFIFIKSWNEWAEGNYLEPDLHYGHGYLKALFEAVSREV